MADIKSPEERSRNMARIRSKNTKPEEYICKMLFHLGYRYRKNSERIFGHPDIWLSKYNTAIFVNGCYWHRHSNCTYAYTPKSRVDFWETKFKRNIERDQIVKTRLSEDGVRILVIWECSIKRMMRKEEEKKRVVAIISDFLHGSCTYLEI